MKIQVLGPGCPKCEETFQLVRKVVDEAGVQAEVEKIMDFQEIAMMGVFSTPAVVVDGEVKIVGRVPAKKDLLAWIRS